VERSKTETTVPKGAEYYMKSPNLMESEFTAHLGLDLRQITQKDIE